MGKFRQQNETFFEVYVTEEVDEYLRMTEWKICIPDCFNSDRQYGFEKSFLDQHSNLIHVHISKDRLIMYGEDISITIDKVHKSTLKNFLDWMDYQFETNGF